VLAPTEARGWWSTGRSSLLVLVVVLPLYLLTMTPAGDINVDAEPVAVPAWHLVQFGTVDLEGFHEADGNPFIGPGAEGRVVSNRPLLLSLLTVPAYVVTNDDTYTPDPSTVSAALITTAAVLVLHLVLRRVVPPPWALGGALVFALGTATWPISSSQLWPHGPGQLVAALVLLALASGRVAWAGLAAGVGVLARPVTAVAPLVLALYAAVQRRWRDAIVLVVPSGLAIVATVAYNAWAFGEPSLSGGYASHFRESLTDQSPLGFARNVANMAVSPANGLFLWSPIVLVALVGLRRSWSSTPDWARQAAVAGLAYMLVHLRLNRASGGLPYDYRYPLEPLMLAAPALVLGVRAFLPGPEWRQRVVVLAVGASLMFQGTMAITYDCDEIVDYELAECSLL
jgi:hypothetical protein